jgi:hypothetical protein
VNIALQIRQILAVPPPRIVDGDGGIGGGGQVFDLPDHRILPAQMDHDCGRHGSY